MSEKRVDFVVGMEVEDVNTGDLLTVATKPYYKEFDGANADNSGWFIGCAEGAGNSCINELFIEDLKPVVVTGGCTPQGAWTKTVTTYPVLSTVKPRTSTVKENVLPELCWDALNAKGVTFPSWSQYYYINARGELITSEYEPVLQTADSGKRGWRTPDGTSWRHYPTVKFSGHNWDSVLLRRSDALPSRTVDIPAGTLVTYNNGSGECVGLVKVCYINGNVLLSDGVTLNHGTFFVLTPWTFENAPLNIKTDSDVLHLRWNEEHLLWVYVSEKDSDRVYSFYEVACNVVQCDGAVCGVLSPA